MYNIYASQDVIENTSTCTTTGAKPIAVAISSMMLWDMQGGEEKKRGKEERGKRIIIKKKENSKERMRRPIL